LTNAAESRKVNGGSSFGAASILAFAQVERFRRVLRKVTPATSKNNNKEEIQWQQR